MGVVHPLPGPFIVFVTEADPGAFIISDMPRFQEFLGVREEWGIRRKIGEGHPSHVCPHSHGPLPHTEVFLCPRLHPLLKLYAFTYALMLWMCGNVIIYVSIHLCVKGEITLSFLSLHT